MRLKIAVVGPTEAGKTTVTNAIGNEASIDAAGARIPYRPTDSVRIVELNMNNIELRKYSVEADVQLWEVGGNPRLKSIWPGVQKDMDGIVIVYDVNNDLHIKDASALHMHFVTHSNSGIAPQQCFFIGNIFRGMREQPPQKILGVSQRVRHIALNVDDDPTQLKQEFRQFITNVAQIVQDREKNNFAGLQVKSTSKQKTVPYVFRKITTAGEESEANNNLPTRHGRRSGSKSHRYTEEDTTFDLI